MTPQFLTFHPTKPSYIGQFILKESPFPCSLLLILALFICPDRSCASVDCFNQLSSFGSLVFSSSHHIHIHHSPFTPLFPLPPPSFFCGGSWWFLVSVSSFYLRFCTSGYPKCPSVRSNIFSLWLLLTEGVT